MSFATVTPDTRATVHLCTRTDCANAPHWYVRFASRVHETDPQTGRHFTEDRAAEFAAYLDRLNTPRPQESR